MLNYQHEEMSLILNHEGNPFLYLGDKDDAVDIYQLQRLGIKYIINCTKELPMEITGIEYLRIPVDDEYNEDISKYFPQVIEFINNAKGKGSILVHCYMGISRSPSFVAVYLMSIGMSFPDTLEYLCARRVVVCPNMSFFIQVKRQEKKRSTLTYESFMMDIYYADSDTCSTPVINI
jgi:hypothetical protein